MEISSSMNAMAEYAMQAQFENGNQNVMNNHRDLLDRALMIQDNGRAAGRIDTMIGEGLTKASDSLNRTVDKLTELARYLEGGGRLTPARSFEFLSVVNTYSIQCHCINSVGKSINDGTKTLFRNQ